MSGTLVPLIGPIPGGMEMVVILLIAVLLFGANKIPKLARSTGQAMGEFRRGREEIEQELEEITDEDDTGATTSVSTSTSTTETQSLDSDASSSDSDTSSSGSDASSSDSDTSPSGSDAQSS